MDARNFRELKKVLQEYGISDRRKVGSEAAETFYLLAMHTPDPGSRQAIFPRIKKAVALGRIKSERLGYLEDRIRYAAGRPLSFGTQFMCPMQAGSPVPLPAENIEHLDMPRQQDGLFPFALYAGAIKQELAHASDICKPATNWRTRELKEEGVRTITLPENLRRQILAIRDAFCLRTISMGTLRDRQEGSWFLEIIQAGQLLWLDQLLEDSLLMAAFFSLLTKHHVPFGWKPVPKAIHFRELMECQEHIALMQKDQEHPILSNEELIS